MVRRIFLSSALVLLASCTQTPEPGADGSDAALTVPATLSTNFDDAAHAVTADAQGNAYVLGYRHYDGNFRTGKVEHPAELFVSQLSPKGTLNWLTNLPSSIVTNDLNVPGIVLELAATDVAVYALTHADTDLIQLHRLEFDGTLSWSKVVARGSLLASDLLVAQNGTLYAAFNTANSSATIIKALNGEGNELWSREVSSTSLTLLGVGGDNGLYLSEPGFFGAEGVRDIYLHKYDAAGSPLWTRNIAPSIPFTPWQYDYPKLTLATRGDAVYTVVDFAQQSPESTDGFSILNTEIRRFAGDGTEVWSTLLYPTSTGSPSSDYRVLPVGVTDDADLYLLVEEREPEGPNPNPTGSYIEHYEEQLFRFFGDGQRTTSAVQTYSDGLEAAVLVPAKVKDARNRPHTVFYTISTIGKNLVCDNDFDLPKPCVYTDVQASLYKNNAALQWSLR